RAGTRARGGAFSFRSQNGGSMIAVEGVTKRYGALVAVDDLSFEIDRGQVVGFLGPNGAGKTTTMRMLAGTLEPDAGVVRIDGRPIGEAPVEAKRRIGYMPESKDRKSTRLNSSHVKITYAVFCL